MERVGEIPKAEPGRRRRWFQFRLRTLLFFIVLRAVLVELWRIQGRLCVLALRSPPLARTAWARLLKLSGIAVSKYTAAAPVDVWPDRNASLMTGWVWVRQRSELRCVTPDGRVLEPGIVTPGSAQILWNSLLSSNNRPGIAILTDSGSGRRDLICLFVIDPDAMRIPRLPGSPKPMPHSDGRNPMPIVRMLVRISHPGATCRVVSESPTPQFELRSADGRFVETFALAETLGEAPVTPPPGLQPWKVIVRQ